MALVVVLASALVVVRASALVAALELEGSAASVEASVALASALEQDRRPC